MSENDEIACLKAEIAEKSDEVARLNAELAKKSELLAKLAGAENVSAIPPPEWYVRKQAAEKIGMLLTTFEKRRAKQLKGDPSALPEAVMRDGHQMWREPDLLRFRIKRKNLPVTSEEFRRLCELEAWSPLSYYQVPLPRCRAHALVFQLKSLFADMHCSLLRFKVGCAMRSNYGNYLSYLGSNLSN